MPIPSHPSRLRERLLDHSGLLAADLAAALGWPADAASLVRLRATPRQVDLAPEARLANVAGAFGAAPQHGRACLLVDDVLTTGATAREAARSLHLAGAGPIWLATVARAAPAVIAARAAGVAAPGPGNGPPPRRPV